MRITFLNSRIIDTVLIIIVSAAVLFFRIGSTPLHSWDEAVYAQSAKEMVQGGDWRTPHWNQQIFLQKPPLFIWATALSFGLLGVSETSARAVSALSGMGCVLLVLLIVRLFASEFTASFASLILLSSFSFNLNARTGMTDVMLTFFMLSAIYAYLRSAHDTRWWWLVGSASGLALMTKGAGALPLFVSLAIVIVWRDSSTVRKQDFWLGVGLCVIIGGAWHLLMLSLHGQVFIADYFKSQVMNRTLELMDSPQARHGAFYYPATLILGFFPGCLLLPFAIIGWLRARSMPLMLPVFAIAVFVLFSFASTKHQWYMIPIFPILSIVAAPLSGKLTPVYVVAIIVGLVFAANMQPSKETFQIATLSKRASLDKGPLGYYPAFKYAPEVLFYSNRPLCADAPDHSMGLLAQCPRPDYAILIADKVPAGSEGLAQSGGFLYCRF
jgi:4-amino-4-deoxy-L-arabinose transferase-like glycosyltransferase